MGAFLSVAKGSTEEPWLLELHYNHPESETRGERPTVLVGKGTDVCIVQVPHIQETTKFKSANIKDAFVPYIVHAFQHQI